jgi:hypothetical protein
MLPKAPAAMGIGRAGGVGIVGNEAEGVATVPVLVTGMLVEAMDKMVGVETGDAVLLEEVGNTAGGEAEEALGVRHGSEIGASNFDLVDRLVVGGVFVDEDMLPEVAEPVSSGAQIGEAGGAEKITG